MSLVHIYNYIWANQHIYICIYVHFKCSCHTLTSAGSWSSFISSQASVYVVFFFPLFAPCFMEHLSIVCSYYRRTGNYLDPHVKCSFPQLPLLFPSHFLLDVNFIPFNFFDAAGAFRWSHWFDKEAQIIEYNVIVILQGFYQLPGGMMEQLFSS